MDYTFVDAKRHKRPGEGTQIIPVYNNREGVVRMRAFLARQKFHIVAAEGLFVAN